VLIVSTRNLAVPRIADRTASQQTLIFRDLCAPYEFDLSRSRDVIGHVTIR